MSEKMTNIDENCPTRVSVCARQGARSSMEDKHIVNVDLFEDGGSHWLLAVFDGHGGDEVARFLERHFAQHVHAAVQNAQSSLVSIAAAGGGCTCPAPIDYCGVLTQSFAAADAALRALAGYASEESVSKSSDSATTGKSKDNSNISDGGSEGTFPIVTDRQQRLRNAGSTAAVALVVDGKTLYCANCGDSEIVWATRRSLCGRKRSRNDTIDEWDVRCLSTLHKPSDACERERIEALGGFVTQMWGICRVQGTLAVARSFGDFTTAPWRNGARVQVICSEPAVSGPHRLQCDDLLIVACDGLWDVSSYGDAVDIAFAHQRRASESGVDERSRPRASSVAHALVRTAIGERNSRDNVSVVVLEMGTPGTLVPVILNDVPEAKSDT